MKPQTRKFSRFQKLILIYLTFVFFSVSFLNLLRSHKINTISLYSFSALVLGPTLFILIFILVPMGLFNKYLAPKIQVKNENLKKSWRIIKIVITCLIILWFILLFIAALYGLFIKK